MIISKCCLMGLTSCYSDRNGAFAPDLERAFAEANAETPSSCYMDYVATGAACGILDAAVTSLVSLTIFPNARDVAVVCMGASCFMIPACALPCLCNPGIQNDDLSRFSSASITSGLFRDWHVVAKTLEKYEEIVAINNR